MERQKLLVFRAVCAAFLLYYTGNLLAQPKERFGVLPAVNQADCPVQMVTVVATQNFLIEEARVKNSSDRTIKGITFGVVIYPTSNLRAKPVVSIAEPSRLLLKPSAIGRVQLWMMQPTEAKEKAHELASPNLEFVLGVVAVEFTDGSSWSYDLLNRGSFGDRARRVSGLSRQGGCELGIPSRLIAQGFEPDWFTCAIVPDPTYCENHFEWCASHACPPGSCPNQHCQWGGGK